MRMRMRCSFLDNKITRTGPATRARKELRLQLFLVISCFLTDLIMSSDTISVMRHNNSCGKTLLDNWVEEVRI